jgi:hypothetical protein
MKYFKLFEEYNSLLEYTSNEKLSIYLLSNILNKIKKVIPNIRFKSIDRSNNDNNSKYSLFSEIETSLKKYQKDDIISIVKTANKSSDMQHYFYDSNYNIVGVKDVYIKRIKPPKNVYHVTYKKNRDSIIKHGLKIDSDSEWNNGMLSYPNAIFASLSMDVLFNYEKDIKDIWVINTNNLNNKWWYDLNFGEDYHYIMTFDDIPSENLELYQSM